MKHQDPAGSSKKSPSQPSDAGKSSKQQQQQPQPSKSKKASATIVADGQQASSAKGRKAQKQQN